MTPISVEFHRKTCPDARVPFNSSRANWSIVPGRADHLVRTKCVFFIAHRPKSTQTCFCLSHKTEGGATKSSEAILLKRVRVSVKAEVSVATQDRAHRQVRHCGGMLVAQTVRPSAIRRTFGKMKVA